MTNPYQIESPALISFSGGCGSTSVTTDLLRTLATAKSCPEGFRVG